MNNADNNNTGNEAGLSDLAHTKPNNNRTSDIYARFLNRVHGIDSSHSIDSDHYRDTNDLAGLDGFKKHSAYEPLNEEELRLFIDYEKDLYSEPSDTTNIDMAFNNDDKVTAVDIHAMAIDDEPAPSNTDLTNLVSKLKADSTSKEAPTQQHKQASSGRFLLIGMVSGVLLSVIIVLLLNRAGLLSASIDRLDADSPKAITNNIPTANTEGKDKVSVSTEETPAVPQSLEANDNRLDTDTVITYEDFTEEAQRTLYRETKD